MKILYSSRVFFPGKESHKLSIIRFCQAYAYQGHEVYLNYLSSPGKSKADVRKFYDLKSPNLKLVPIISKFNHNKKNSLSNILRFDWLEFSYKFCSLVSEIRPNLLHVRLVSSHACLAPVLPLIHRNFPIIAELHSDSVFKKDSNLKKLYYYYSNNYPEQLKLIVTTDMLRNYLQKKMPQASINTIRHSSAPHIKISNKKLSEFKEHQIKGSHKFNVGFTGSHIPKTTIRGIQIIGQLSELLPDIGFHIVGGKKKEVKYWSDKYPSTNLHFYGYVNQSEIPYFLNCFDVALSPLQTEKKRVGNFYKGMSPTKIAEYLACGCVILASDAPGHQEILTDEENCLIVRAADISDWKNKLQKLIGNKELRKKLSKNAIKTYKKEFSHQKRIKKVLSILND